MSTVALAVGVAVSSTFVLIIMGVVILICVLSKQKKPRRRTAVRNVKKGTESIKRKAEKLKADKSSSSCCALSSCCRGRRSDGPFPDPPFAVELQDPTSSEITILWNEPKRGNNAVPIEGYIIYKRFNTSPDDWTKVGKVTVDELEFRITKLTPYKRYVFGVSAKGNNGESTIVETQPTSLKKDPVKPGAPTEFDVINRASTSMTLSWKPPRKVGYSRIHTYYLLIKDCGGNTPWTHQTTLPAFDRFMDYKVTGLKPNHPYRFRVNAENIAGRGPYAETITFETTDVEPEPPEKAKGPIKYSKISHNSVTLSWRPSEQDGGQPVSGYAVEYKEKGEKGWHKAGVCEANTTKLAVSVLQEDIEYVFRVIAINIVGNSKPLVGPKVRTKLLEIPRSRRSSVRLSSLQNSRESARDRPSIGDATDTEVEIKTLKDKLEGLDPHLEADPFVPKTDFFTYDETNSGNISNRHGDNRTRHSQFSPLPVPPPSDSPRKRGKYGEMGVKHRHSDYSPLPRPKSYQDVNGNIKHSAESDLESEDASSAENDAVGSTELSEFGRLGEVIRHQPTPSNIAYRHSRF